MAEREWSSIPEDDARRFQKTFEQLANWSPNLQIKKLAGRGDFAVRVSRGYRIRFTRDGNSIRVLALRHRRDGDSRTYGEKLI